MAGAISNYTYDFLGRRIKKAISNQPSAISYCYDGDNLIAEYDDSGNLLKKYIYGSGIDEVLRCTMYEVRIISTIVTL